MSRLIMLCGLPGSGKTTLAKILERELPALRFCPDEWVVPLLAVTLPDQKADPIRDTIEALQWSTAQRALNLGINVVLENGFWAKEERLKYRELAEGLGAQVEIRYLDVPREELLARLAKRNANLPEATLPVSEEELDLWSSWFERPTPEELT